MMGQPLPGVTLDSVTCRIQETRHAAVPYADIPAFKLAIKTHACCVEVAGPYADDSYAVVFKCAENTPEELHDFLMRKWLQYAKETEWKVL